MSDLERRLRAALAAAAEPPPAGLMDGIRRRHRRYLRRLRAAGAAAAAVVLVTGSLAAHSALSGSAGPGPAGAGLAGSGPSASARPVISPLPGVAPAAPGTVLRDCASADGGTLGAHWQAQSEHAGPVWFIYGRLASTHPRSRALPGGKVTASAMAIAVSDGRAAVVTVAPKTAGAFRFLPGVSNSNVYTLRDGAPRLTLRGCPAGPAGTHVPASYAPGLTMFWQGYLTGLTGCVRLRVHSGPAGQEIPVTLRLSGGSCSS